MRTPLAVVGALAGAAIATAGCGGSARTTATTTAPHVRPGVPPRTAAPRRVHHAYRSRPSPAQIALGLPPVPRGPVPGYVLIADRNNNRLLIVSPTGHIVWRFPHPGDVRRGESFHDPDDAFFAPSYGRLVTNEEFNDAVVQIDLRTRRIVWSYGRPGVAGSSAGELSNPDDAYRLRNGLIQVADIQNCRVLRISEARRIVSSYGSPGSCVHDPPRSFHSPNGATPLPDGGTLVTEIGGWVDRLDARGRLVFSVRTPTTYPSDAQLLPNGHILVAGFNTPGRVDEITPPGTDRVDVRAARGAGVARPALARRPLAERHDRRHRRLAPSDRRHRPADEADRVAVRAPRGRLIGGRLPVQAGRPRSPAGPVRALGADTAGDRPPHRGAAGGRVPPRCDLPPARASSRPRRPCRRRIERLGPGRPAGVAPPRRASPGADA